MQQSRTGPEIRWDDKNLKSTEVNYVLKRYLGTEGECEGDIHLPYDCVR